ncbi:alpha/beta hydrolase [Flaviaesturariibacter amylovorans]|uniref:Esterase n=1 Tax=Flaviaesturariibacter amylovorans TaxID=1084520 RepID=A0ABP8HJJ7_9BACT
MQLAEHSCIIVERQLIYSADLHRYVTVDFYLPKNVVDPSALSLLLINDGQDLSKMPFDTLLNGLMESGQMKPVLCVGVHAGRDRKMEYGTAKVLDFQGRGARAAAYERFVLNKLLPHVHSFYCIESFSTKAIAGFSLGGLSAIDSAWSHPDVFRIAGVFSGSLWWRIRDLEDGYVEETDRIMHQQVRKGKHHKGLRFYFTTGSLDETSDRNHNGIIDSIDDTLSLIGELKEKGYTDKDICYVNYEDGRHDVATWGRAFPHFLLWAFGK